MLNRLFNILPIFLILAGCYPGKQAGNINPGPDVDSGYARINETKLFYKVAGKGKPVLFAHAGFMDHHMWDTQVSAFAGAGFKVITFDLPAHGKSTNADPALTLPDYINALLNHLRIDKVHLVGLSLGSTSITDFAVAHPETVDKMVLVSGSVTGLEKVVVFDDTITKYFSEIRDAMENRGGDSTAKIFTKYWGDGLRPPGEMDPAVRNYVYTTAALSIKEHGGWKQWARFKENDAVAKLNQLKMPVLIVHGNKDLKIITEAAFLLDERIPDSRRIEIKEVAHMLNMEAPEEFNSIVIAFLKNWKDKDNVQH